MNIDNTPDNVTTLAEVLAGIEKYITYFKQTNSPLGYFPALYQKVAHKIEQGVQNKIFDDNERMVKMDVTFVNRYFDAMDKHISGQQPTRVWQLTVKAAQQWRPIVLQHLVLAMNAHINLDLSVAAAITCKGNTIHSFQKDFEKVNGILSSLLDNVQNDLALIFPPLKIYNRLVGKWDDQLIAKAMKEVRDIAWDNAVKMANMNTEAMAEHLDSMDKKVALIGQLALTPPSLWVNTVLYFVRVMERGTVAQKIDKLLIN